MKDKPNRTQITVRITVEADKLLTALAREKGINRAPMVEILIREAAKAEGIYIVDGEIST